MTALEEERRGTEAAGGLSLPAEPAGASGMRAELGAYLRSIAAFGPARLTRTAAIVGLGTIVEGLGIVLLVPLLGIVAGVAPSRFATATFAALGVQGAGARLALILGLFALLAALRAVILWWREMSLTRLSLELVDSWRARIVNALAGAGWPVLARMRRSNIEFVITSEVSRLATGSDRLLRGMSSLLQLVVQVVVAVWLAPLLSLAAVVLIGVAVPLLLPMLRAAHRFGGDITRGNSKRQSSMSDFIGGMKLAKAYDVEHRYAEDFMAQSTAMRRRQIAYTGAQQRAANAFQVVAVLAAIALLVIGLFVTHTPVPVLSAVLVLFARLSGPVMQLAQGAQALVSMLPAVGSLIDTERDLQAGTAAAPGMPPVVRSEGPARVVLEGVTYRHDENGEPVLRGADLTIGAGELVVLLGPSGVGKTTLADIVGGLIAPDAGMLRIDDAAVADADARAAWRRQTGNVPQDPFLFDASLLDNLRWATPAASEADIWRALEAAEAAAFVRAMPAGLGTRMGDRGQRLSGGERQRICLARALLRQPRLLILDEATSALDRATELRLFETLRHLRGTVSILMITHRLPAEAAPDRCYRLEHGVLHVTKNEAL